MEKACTLIAQVGAEGARLAVFPEAFIPAYPLWVWYIPPGETQALRDLYSELLANSVAIPGPATDRLCEAAREAGITVAIGVNERNAEASGTTLYNTILYIDAEGNILGKHRKLVPTAGERLIWGSGDGSTLEVYDSPVGRLGGLICWENYMPLARYAMIAWGVQLYVAPTWDRGEPWLSTLRHMAKEGRCYVIGSCSALRKEDIPDRLEFKKKFLSGAGEWLNPGHSMIVNIDGKVAAGPAEKEETVLYAEVHPSEFLGPRFQLDAAGHYARPDIFELIVHRDERPMIRTAGRPEGERLTDDS